MKTKKYLSRHQPENNAGYALLDLLHDHDLLMSDSLTHLRGTVSSVGAASWESRVPGCLVFMVSFHGHFDALRSLSKTLYDFCSTSNLGDENAWSCQEIDGSFKSTRF